MMPLISDKLEGMKMPGLQKLQHPIAAMAGIEIDVLRLDDIHPVISGNKWFKLQYHLAKAIDEKKKGIVTYGGAWSNHIVATAFSCRMSGLSSIGYIRGEKPALLSPSLQDAEKFGMKLIFIPRSEYAAICRLEIQDAAFADCLVIPEGGKTPDGIRGASEILGLFNSEAYSHIACATGTGTTMAGLLQASSPKQQVIGVSAIRVPDSSDNEILSFIKNQDIHGNGNIFFDYHFGGYAKKDNGLITFMNDLYERYNIPTDFVYTAKLFYGILDLAEKGLFPRGSDICIIHSGGLQGNRSLSLSEIRF